MLTSPAFAGDCSIRIVVDLNNKITTKGHPLSEIKKKVNGLVSIYQKDICLDFVDASLVEKIFIKLNFDIDKARTRFIDGKKSKD